MIVYLTSNKFNGIITIVYSPDVFGVNRLIGLHIEGEITEIQYRYVMDNLAYEYPSDGVGVCGVLKSSIHIDGSELIKQAKKKAQNSNIRLFCGLYKEVFGFSYKVSGKDISLSQTAVSFDAELIRLFLTEKRWWNKDRYTLENYAKNYNTLVLIKNEVAKDNQGFIDHYDPEYERAVPTEIISEYWNHLREMGWTPYKNENGKLIGMTDKEGKIVLKYQNK